MSVLEILRFPDKRLRIIAEPVKKVNDRIQRIVHDMFETMHNKKGIGLAATQVNIHQQIITINIISDHYENDVIKPSNQSWVLINPKLLHTSGETSIEEGCLSIPGQYALIPRAEKVMIKALDIKGELFYLEAHGLLAICIQHEIDHLIGKLFIDYLSPLKRQRIRQRLDKIAKFKARSK
ncbi:peptide deformylase [Candidatus Fukatsuia anoeciicola]|uniref:peptide deformylase n=1 Tax=Candidatus Fukatsuia anoeciicola TaxID=2994492 RepID=UPI003463BA5E